MVKKQFRLRPFPIVAIAYVVAPIAGITAANILSEVLGIMHGSPPDHLFGSYTPGHGADPGFLGALVESLLGIGTFCFIIELIVTPWILWLRKHRPEWLSLKAALFTGFIVGASCCLLVVTSLGPKAFSIFGDVALPGFAGATGMMIAAVFQLIAIREVPPRIPVEVFGD